MEHDSFTSPHVARELGRYDAYLRGLTGRLGQTMG